MPIADCDSRGLEQEHSDSAFGIRQSAFERTLRLPVPLCDAKVFLKLLQLDLKGNPPPSPVVKVWLRAEPVAPRVAQQGLFLPAAPQPERLELTLKRLANVVADRRLPNHGVAKPAGDVPLDARQSAIGEAPARVGSPEVLDSHRPDAFRVNPFVVEEADGQRLTADGNRQSEFGTRQCLSALRVFRPPLPVTVSMREERPAALQCAERPRLRGDITWCAGPWRMSGEWWSLPNADCRLPNERPLEIRQSTIGHRHSLPGWAREEWDIAVHNEDGTALYRLYYDVAAKAWFLFGSYD